MRDFRGTWWSLNDALFWIASPTRRPLWQTLILENKRTDFDVHAFFSAVSELAATLLDGDISAHASVDTAPVALVSTPYWSSVKFVPCWGDLSFPWTDIWPDTLVLSERPFRAEALLDHSEPSHTAIPDAGNPEGEFGYFRVTADVVFHRNDILKLWPLEQIDESVEKTQPKIRKRRDLTIKVEQYLAEMTHNGLSLAEDKQDLSYAKIADKLMLRWDDEGDRTVYELDAIKKSVERYYKRNALPSEDHG